MTAYDVMQGKDLVGSPFEEMESVNVPPHSIRQHFNAPSRFHLASLDRSVEHLFDQSVFDICRKYVQEFQRHRKTGQSLALFGDTGVGKTWAAAAVLNEIVRIWADGGSVTTAWLSVPTDLPKLFQYEAFRKQPEYYALFNRYQQANILVIDDLLHMPAHDFSKTKSFLYALLDYRYMRQRPVIITANAKVTKDDWSDIEDVMDGSFVRRIQQMTAGYTVVTGG